MIGKRYAIIVGSNNYEERPLKSTFSDTKDMQKILIQRCRFEEANILVFNFDLGNKNCAVELNQAFDKIKDVIQKEDIFLFYFSGHGYSNSSQSTSFIELSDNEEYSITDIFNKVENFQCQYSYLIIDACQSGYRPKGSLNGLFKEAKGIFYLAATSEDKFAYETGKENSLFMRHFKKVINDKGKYLDYQNMKVLSIEMIAESIRVLLNLHSKRKQSPTTYNYDNNIPHPFAFWDDKEEEIKPKEKIKLSFEVDINSPYLKMVDLISVPQNKFDWNIFLHLLDTYDKVNNKQDDYFAPLARIFSKNKSSFKKLNDEYVLYFLDMFLIQLRNYCDWEHTDIWEEYAEFIYYIYETTKSYNVKIKCFCFLWYFANKSWNVVVGEAKKKIQEVFKNKPYINNQKFYQDIGQELYDAKINTYDLALQYFANDKVSIPTPIEEVARKLKQEDFAKNSPNDV
jgi:hypothetical protein